MSLHLTPAMPQVRNISCFGLQYVAQIWLPMLMCYIATDFTEKLADFISEGAQHGAELLF